MASKKTEIPVQKILKEMSVNITITGVKTFHIRKRIGLFFVKLGIRIFGMKPIIQEENLEGSHQGGK